MDAYRCDECRYERSLDDAAKSGDEIRVGAEQLGTLVLEHPEDAARRRTPDLWSPLEYACHVRDVLLVQRERVLMARREERPSFAPMGREERVVHDGYAEQQPADVARQLEDAARLFVNVLARLRGDDWQRTVLYSYPKLTERSLEWVAVHTLHEVRHHLLDAQRQLDGAM